MTSKSISSIPSQLSAHSQRALSGLDRTFTRLSAILATAAGTDKFLLTIYYTLKFLAPQIARLRALRARRFISSFVNKASATLLPGETLITILEERNDNLLAELETSMRTAAGMITEFRMFTRLWGLLGLYAWAKRTYVSPPADGLTRGVVWTQLASLAGYQVLENVAYLSGKGVLRGPRFDASRQKRFWLVSCRFWMAYVGLEGVRLVRDWQLNHTGKYAVDEKDSGEKAAKRKEDTAAWRRAWYANAAYAPMTVHYSVEGGCLNDEQVGLLGVIVGFISFGHMWRQTA